MTEKIDTSREAERWEELRTGLYDAIYGKGLSQPYLHATARLLDELKRDYLALLTERDAQAARVRELEEQIAEARTPPDGAIDLHKMIGNLQAKIRKLEEQLSEAQAENTCDACAGEGTATSGPCMCKGTGKMSVAAVYLREQLAEAREDSERWDHVEEHGGVMLYIPSLGPKPWVYTGGDGASCRDAETVRGAVSAVMRLDTARTASEEG